MLCTIVSSINVSGLSLQSRGSVSASGTIVQGYLRNMIMQKLKPPCVIVSTSLLPTLRQISPGVGAGSNGSNSWKRLRMSPDLVKKPCSAIQFDSVPAILIGSRLSPYELSMKNHLLVGSCEADELNAVPLRCKADQRSKKRPKCFQVDCQSFSSGKTKM